MSRIERPNPVRIALLSFFEALLSCNVTHTNPDIPDQNVHDAAAEFHRVAEQHYDAHATRSDALYARLVTVLDYISVAHLQKLCEGFRIIDLQHAYCDLNAAHVQPAAGVKALSTGCEQGIEPVAISYRHSLHELVSGSISIPHATVSKSTAEQFANTLKNHNEGDHVNKQSFMPTAVVWIDRAVKGLSKDGDWFVRGLLPYSLVRIVGAYTRNEDLSRPWIWLEFRLSTRAFTAGGLEAVVQFRDALLIAVEAMFAPSNMLEHYEYKDEMEAVILDMFAFGLLGMVSKSSVQGSRIDAVADWSDYKVGLGIALACCASIGDDRLTKFGTLKLDDRDPYGCALFREGLELMLSSVGMEIRRSKEFTAYGMVSGGTVVTKRRDDKLVALTRVPSRVLSILGDQKGGKTIRDHFREEVRGLQLRYDLCDTPNGDMYDATDELSLLAACNVELLQIRRWRVLARDDADATVSPSLARKAGLIDEPAELRISFDRKKAVLNARRRRQFSLRLWAGRVRERQRENGDEGAVRSNRSSCDEGVDVEKVDDVRMWLDYNKGTLRWVTSLRGDGKSVVFRRLSFRRDSHLAAVALRCAPCYAPKKVVSLLAGLDPKRGRADTSIGEAESAGYDDEVWVLRGLPR